MCCVFVRACAEQIAVPPYWRGHVLSCATRRLWNGTAQSAILEEARAILMACPILLNCPTVPQKRGALFFVLFITATLSKHARKLLWRVKVAKRCSHHIGAGEISF